MAQSSSGNNWGVYLDRDLSENGHGISVNWRGGFYSEGWNFEINGTPFAWDFNGGGSVTQSISCGMHVYTQMASGSFWIAKGHSAFTYQMKAWCDRTGAGQYKPGYAEVYNNISVPQLEHHQYMFDANGGSGAPGQVTKWYGEQLAIPSAKPTRKNYSFLGWAHSNTATTPEYSSENSYWTPDEDTTLYAVWHLDYVAPKITAMTALRAGDTKGTAAPLGTCGYVSVSFEGGTDAVTSVTISDSLGKAWTVGGTTSGTSGTATAYCSLAQTEETTVTATVTDGTGKAVQTRYISTITPPIDVGLHGTAVGILASATKAGLTLPGTRYCLGQQEVPSMLYGTKPDASSVPATPAIIIAKDGTQYFAEDADTFYQLGGEELYRDNERPAKIPSAITISADLNRYREIEVFGCTNEWIRCSCRLFKPANAGTIYVWDQCHFVLQAQNISGSTVYQRWTNWSIKQSASGVKFTPDHFMETSLSGSGCSTYGDVGIQIVRISGWV